MYDTSPEIWTSKCTNFNGDSRSIQHNIFESGKVTFYSNLSEKKNKIRKICVKQNTELHNWIISSPESVNIRGQIHRKLKKLILQLYFWHPLVNFFCILITATMKGWSIKFYSSTTYLTDIRKIIFYISFILQHCCYYNCILGMSPWMRLK